MRGHTLVELTFVLVLMGVTASSLVPPARRASDRLAVGAAREALVAAISEARLAAVETGASSVRIDPVSDLLEASAAGRVLRRIDLGEELGVAVEVGGGGAAVVLSYDALGLGRMASLTVGFRRGTSSAELVISSYGRVRRR